MTPTYLRVLCTALGFTAVVMHGGRVPKKEAAGRATEFAALIEEFCRASAPEAFEHAGEGLRIVDLVTTNPVGKFGLADRMAAAIAELYREQGGGLPQDLLAKGFTPDEVDRHWAMAKALAQVALKITDA
jgi:hypothetical protein